VITHGEDGLIVPFGDVDRLASSIACLLDDAPLRNRLGAQGRSTMLRRWTWDVLMNDIRALYAAA